MDKEPLVFLSYAREDQRDAEKIFEDLRRHGVNIWADFDSLTPGSKWEIAIKRAIKDSRYFLAVFSSKSVFKKGFVQKEITMALDILDEFPEQEIYIIPIRLNECSPSHEKLKELHWVNMFPSWSDGIRRILSAVAQSSTASRFINAGNKQKTIIYCRYCGTSPGTPLPCYGAAPHDFKSYTGRVYCRYCGASPGTSLPCYGAALHDFIESK